MYLVIYHGKTWSACKSALKHAHASERKVKIYSVHMCRYIFLHDKTQTLLFFMCWISFQVMLFSVYMYIFIWNFRWMKSFRFIIILENFEKKKCIAIELKFLYLILIKVICDSVFLKISFTSKFDIYKVKEVL